MGLIALMMQARELVYQVFTYFHLEADATLCASAPSAFVRVGQYATLSILIYRTQITSLTSYFL
jgi:hypothetical protein